MYATYHRALVPQAVKATCPCCLKQHRAKRDGTVTRHGWKETGRVVGSYGNGFQWGSCNGWSKRPLEQTDVDALAVIDGLQTEIDGATAELDEHVHGRDVYRFSATRQDYSGTKFAKSLAKVVEALDVECKVTDTKIRKQGACVYYADGIKYLFTMPRGHGPIVVTNADVIGYGSTHNKALVVPSWDTLRQRYIESLETFIAEAKAQQEAIAEAIAHHKANPSQWHVAATEAAEPEATTLAAASDEAVVEHLSKRSKGQLIDLYCQSLANNLGRCDTPVTVADVTADIQPMLPLWGGV